MTISYTNSGNIRFVFSDGTASFTVTTCSSGTCTQVAKTYYSQLFNTYQQTPKAQTTNDPSLTYTATGSDRGVSGATICTIAPAESSGSSSCSGWADYNTLVTLPLNPTGAASNVRWQASGTRVFTQTTGGNLNNVDYYKQVNNIVQVSPKAQTTWDPELSFSITGAHLGSTATLVKFTPPEGSGLQSAAVWSDFNAAITFPAEPSGQTPASRWRNSADGPSTITPTSGGNTYVVDYYRQWQISITIVSVGTPSPFDGTTSFVITKTYLGASNTSATMTPANAATSVTGSLWVDHNTKILFPATSSSNPPNKRYQNSNDSPTTSSLISSGGSTISQTYYSQWLNTIEAKVAAGHPPFPSGAIILVTKTYLGTQGVPALLPCSGVLSCQSAYWIDHNAAFVFSTDSSGSPVNERHRSSDTPMQTSSVTGGGNKYTVVYYKQLLNTYRIKANAQATFDPGLTCTVRGTYLGVLNSIIAIINPTEGSASASSAGYIDYNTPTLFTATCSGAPPNSRWILRGTSTFIASTGGSVYEAAYYKQWVLTALGGSGIRYSVPSQTDDNYWDHGTSLTVSSNGIYNRAEGVGQRVSSWNIDGGSNTKVATIGTVTTVSITMTAPHAVIFSSVTQFQLNTPSGSLVSITPPAIEADNGWYDSGTSVTAVYNYVWDVVDERSRITAVGYSVDGAKTSIPRAGVGTFSITLVMDNPHLLEVIAIIQYWVKVIDNFVDDARQQVVFQSWVDDTSKFTLPPHPSAGEGVEYRPLSSQVQPLIVDAPKVIVREFGTFFRVDFVSKYGNAYGSGWYRKSSSAEFGLVETSVPLPGDDLLSTLLRTLGSILQMSGWRSTDGSLKFDYLRGAIQVTGPVELKAVWVENHLVTAIVGAGIGAAISAGAVLAGVPGVDRLLAEGLRNRGRGNINCDCNKVAFTNGAKKGDYIWTSIQKSDFPLKNGLLLNSKFVSRFYLDCQRSGPCADEDVCVGELFFTDEEEEWVIEFPPNWSGSPHYDYSVSGSGKGARLKLNPGRVTGPVELLTPCNAPPPGRLNEVEGEVRITAPSVVLEKLKNNIIENLFKKEGSTETRPELYLRLKLNAISVCNNAEDIVGSIELKCKFRLDYAFFEFVMCKGCTPHCAPTGIGNYVCAVRTPLEWISKDAERVGPDIELPKSEEK